MNKNTVLGALIASKVQDGNNELQEVGKTIGRLYTDHGLPIDMALERLPYTKEQKISVLDGACQWFIEHKRLSGATEKAIDRQRDANRKMLEDFITRGEVGVY